MPDPIFQNLAKDQTAQDIKTAVGTAGAGAPTIVGTGVIGWLRALFGLVQDGITVSGPVTDAELRATPLPVSVSDVATETTLAATKAGIGAAADASASSDSGTFSIVALIKRGLANWTTLQAKIPALSSGRVPVDVQATVLATGAATEAKQDDAITSLGADGATPPSITGTGVRGWLRGIYEKLSGALTVTGPLTDAQLRATPIDVNGSFSIAGGATAANQALEIAGLASIDGTLTNLEGFFKSEDTAAASGDKGMVMLAQRFASDAPTTDADGDYTTLKLDEEGRLKVASKPASYADITGDITAIQATIGTPVAGGTVGGDVSRASNLMIFCVGTFSGINCTFEGSLEATGDTNWFAVQTVRSNANTIELVTGVLSAQPAYAWEASVNALRRFRVRCTARTSGTQSWRFVQGTYATEPIPAAQVSATQPISGSLTAVTTVSAVTSGNLGIPGIIADVASAAITTTTTTAAFTPTFGVSYEVNIPVTVMTGTSPTLDVVVQESDNSGTDWFDVYTFPRITATGIYRSPKMPLTGNRVRYVQTVGGGSPSFTRSINRLQSSDPATMLRPQVILNALNAAGLGLWYSDRGERPTFDIWLSGTGAVTATVKIWARNQANGKNLIGTAVMSGTNNAYDLGTADYRCSAYMAELVSITGTGAAVTVAMSS